MRRLTTIFLLILSCYGYSQPVTTGSVVTHGSSANSGSTSITVPADATLAVVFWSGWQSGGSQNMTSLSINSVGLTLATNLSQSGDAPACGVGFLANPATGSQTFAWDWSGTAEIGEGCPFVIRFLKGINTSDPARDSDATNWEFEPLTNSVTLTTQSTDYVLGAVQSYGPTVNPDGAPDGSGQTVDENDFLFNEEAVDLAHEDTPGVSTTEFSGTGRYGTVVAIAIKEAEEGAAGTFKPQAMSY